MSWAPDRDSAWARMHNVGTAGLLGKIDSWLFSNDPIVNEPGDVSRQTASEGGERNIIYGRVRPIGGNLINVQEPRRRWTPSLVEGTGKGTDEPTVQWTLRTYRTYAVGICEGPITGIIKVWRNDKLVYDASGTKWGKKNNPVFLRQYKFYLGDYLQQPSPELEAIWGVGLVPAYRGTAYMVAVNEDLTELGGAVPQFIFEVERSEGAYLTSRPYGLEVVEDMQSFNESGFVEPWALQDNMQAGQLAIESGTLVVVDVPIEYALAEEMESGALAFTAGTLVDKGTEVKYYWPEEEMQAGVFVVTAGTLAVTLITYDDWPLEEMQAGTFELTGGTLA